MHLTALREQTGDVLVSRTTPCVGGDCGMSPQERVSLPPDALTLDAEGFAGRSAEVTLSVDGADCQVDGGTGDAVSERAGSEPEPDPFAL